MRSNMIELKWVVLIIKVNGKTIINCENLFIMNLRMGTGLGL